MPFKQLQLKESGIVYLPMRLLVNSITLLCYIWLILSCGISAAQQPHNAQDSLTKSGSPPKTIKLIGPQSEADATQIYFETLIIQALDKSEGPWKGARLQRIPYSEAAHGGVIRLLKLSIVDIYFTAPTEEKENVLLPVRIPLMAGLLGYRVSVTHRDKVETLRNSNTNLRQLNACQVRFWTDLDILQHNQFTVVPTDSFEKTWELTAIKKCDYFPRSIFEGYSELEEASKRYTELVIFDDVILSYPFALYVFTAKHNITLNQQISMGLNRMIQDGSFAAFLRSSPVTKHLFPLSKWRNREFIYLDNPFLPESAPLDKSEYWITLENP